MQIKQISLKILYIIFFKRYFDTEQERYEKMKQVCQRFDILEFGLSAFIYDDLLNKFRHFQLYF